MVMKKVKPKIYSHAHTVVAMCVHAEHLPRRSVALPQRAHASLIIETGILPKYIFHCCLCVYKSLV